MAKKICLAFKKKKLEIFFFSVNASAKIVPGAQLQSILENKGGIEVTDYGQFGSLMFGEKRELVLWIQ